MHYNVTTKVRGHYDLVSPFYKDLWGDHIHHGYWETGEESKEVAAENLIKLLVRHAEIQRGAKVLDVGCGIGSTSIWLAKNLDCEVTGITISPVQVQMATEAARSLPNKPTFVVEDANSLSLTDKFDVIWAVEMISHLNKRDHFFKSAAKLLKPGGRMCITDWLEDDHISLADKRKYIVPIERGMLVDLPSLTEYKRHFDENGLRILYYEDLNEKVAKTWDISVGLVKKPALWRLARKHGKEFVAFLKSFQAMRRGFRTGAFRYAAMVAEKPQLIRRKH